MQRSGRFGGGSPATGPSKTTPPLEQRDDAVGDVLEVVEVLRDEDDRTARRRGRRARSPRAAAAGAGRARRSARRAAAPAGRASSEIARSSRCRLPTESARRGAVVGRQLEPREQRRRVAGPLEPREELEVLTRREPPVVGGPLRHPADADAPRARSTVPLLGCSAPARIASSVDLPAPFGPTSASASPGGTSRSVGLRARRGRRSGGRRRARREQSAIYALRALGLSHRHDGGGGRLLDLDLDRHRAALGPRLELDALGEELVHRAAGGEQRQRDEDPGQPVDLPAGEQAEDDEQRVEPERAPHHLRDDDVALDLVDDEEEDRHPDAARSGGRRPRRCRPGSRRARGRGTGSAR